VTPGSAAKPRRSVAADTVGGFAMPANSDVVLSPYLVQRHPAHWTDPARFDPDRFLPENNDRRNRFAYLPFGLGPRACIGEHLALVEMHTHVATLARHFDLELLPGQIIELEPQVNLRMRHSLRMIPRIRA
jgi:cytochrome P450